MNIPDCYDPVYQAEQREREADEKRLHCEVCGKPITEEYWEIDAEILCRDCMDYYYKHSVEEFD